MWRSDFIFLFMSYFCLFICFCYYYFVFIFNPFNMYKAYIYKKSVTTQTTVNSEIYAISYSDPPPPTKIKKN